MRPRATTEPLGQRVAALESEAWAQAAKLAEHKAAVEVRFREDELVIKDHEKWLNQVRGSLRTLAVLWAVAVALLGMHFVQEWIARPVSAASAKP